MDDPSSTRARRAGRIRDIFISEDRFRRIRREELVLRSELRRRCIEDPGVRYFTCHCGSLECVGVPLLARESIRFSDGNERWNFLSNSFPAPIRVKKRWWPTAEHYFQAQKFAGTPREQSVRKALTPALAVSLGRDPRHPPRHGWDADKVSVLRTAVLAKFDQHDDLRRRLLDTGDALLRCDDDGEDYRRSGRGKRGGPLDERDVFGQILMEARASLRER